MLSTVEAAFAPLLLDATSSSSATKSTRGTCVACNSQNNHEFLLPLYQVPPGGGQKGGSRRRSFLKSASSSSSSEGGAESTTTTTGVGGWRGQLLQASNIASLLCVLDCTALPIVTVVLPFFGWFAFNPAQMELLHQLGHSVALFFVLPVGGSATVLNYWYAHQQKRIAALGVLGLLLVAMANAPHGVVHGLHHSSNFLVTTVVYPLVHAVHHGLAHRFTNLLGCACLLGSNYLSKKSGKCLHGHDHSECSDHNGGQSSAQEQQQQPHVHGPNCSHDHKQ